MSFRSRRSGRDQWLSWFAEVGYIENGNPTEPPERVTLYRGGAEPDRMAWTSSRFVGEWFRDRWSNGRLWIATAEAKHLLMNSNNVRLDKSGRSEDEYVINPAEIAFEAIDRLDPFG